MAGLFDRLSKPNTQPGVRFIRVSTMTGAIWLYAVNERTKFSLLQNLNDELDPDPPLSAEAQDDLLDMAKFIDGTTGINDTVPERFARGASLLPALGSWETGANDITEQEIRDGYEKLGVIWNGI